MTLPPRNHCQNRPELQTIDLLGIPFPILDYSNTIEIFSEWISAKPREPHQVCTINVHTLTTCQHDRALRDIMHSAALVTMDGQPVRWLANLKYGLQIKDRVCGPDLMLRCLEVGQSHNWRHYFLGGRPHVLEWLITSLRSRFPRAHIAGYHAPPFRPLTEDETKGLLSDINASKPDFLWVGLGAPKQEKWIYAHLDRIHAPVQVGIGAAIDFFADNIPRAPRWVQRLGLEWLFRTLQDPKRLWKRYLVTNSLFIFLAAGELFKTWVPLKKD